MPKPVNSTKAFENAATGTPAERYVLRLYVAGSSVTGLRANEALGGFVDLATMGVK